MSDLHDHQHPAPGNVADIEGLDPAGKALTDALRVSFVFLKLVMLSVLALFIYSGTFTVEQNEQAVVLRFGKVVNLGPKAIKSPGWHWAWPALDEVVKIPAPQARIQLDADAFWYAETELEKLGQASSRPPGSTLQFVRDGYSLTAATPAAENSAAGMAGDQLPDDGPGSTVSSPVTDYNLVHTRWVIRYNVADPLALFRQLWDGTSGDPQTGTRGWYAVNELLRSVLAQSVITASAYHDIDDILWGKALQFADDVERRMTAHLKQLDVGLDAELVLVANKPPRQVKAAFEQASQANLTKQSLITAAEANANKIVSEAEAQASNLTAQAHAYSTKITQYAGADAQYLDEILNRINTTATEKVLDTMPDYQAQRQKVSNDLLAVTIDQLYQETLRQVMANADEVLVAPPSGGAPVEWRIYLSRDATLAKPVRSQTQQND